MKDLSYINSSLVLSSGLDRFVSLRRKVTYQSMRVFYGWGYQEMQVPLIDHFDAYKRTVEDEVEDAVRFVDRKGDVMMLLSDVTPAISRLVAFGLNKKNIPVRTSYANKVFRSQATTSKKGIESYHLGIELVGVKSLCGEVEVFLVALEVLDNLGVNDFQFNVTDRGIVDYLLNATGAPKRIREQVLNSIIARDASEVEFILTRLGIRSHFIKAVSALASLEGGLHQLNLIQEALPNDKVLAGRLESMRTLFRVLSELGYKKRIRLDMAALSGGVKYYTGIAFEIVSEDIGRSLGGGGRYDDLYGKFGASYPAIGFSLLADTIVEILHPITEDFEHENPPKVEEISIDSEHLVDGFHEVLVRRSYNKTITISELS